MRWIPIGLMFALAGCAASPQPVNKPCGVITDSLQNVNATSTVGQERLDVHFERGAAAGCWHRVGHLPVLDAPKVSKKAHPKPRPSPAPVWQPEPPVAPVDPTPAPVVVAPPEVVVPPPPPPPLTFREKIFQHLNAGIKP